MCGKPLASGFHTPRLLMRDQVRDYLQIEDAELAQRMARGQIPGPLWGCDPALPSARRDRKGIDRAIDRASMIPINDLAGVEELGRALGTWRYASTRR
jgi:hypothetical protein